MGRHFTGFSAGSKASSTKSYHNGGVEGASFSKWYDKYLAAHFDETEDDSKGSGGTKGSGSGGTKGSGSGGSKGSGSGGTKGSGSGGTKGSGSGGTKGSGSGGTKGSGSGGTKGSGSGGTKGSGSGGTKGSGSGGTKGSGSGGTKGSGSGGTKGSGSGGTKGSGSGGTAGGGGTPGDGKSVLNFVMGSPAEVKISVTETPEGQLFFNLTPTDFEDKPVDIDGIFFNLSNNSKLSSLNFFPGENTRDVTDIQAEPDGVSSLPNGAGVGENFDVGLQFGTVPDSSEGTINATNFTLWSDDGPVRFEDIDLSGMRLVVDSDETGGEVLGVSDSDDADWNAGDAVPDSDIVLEDVMAIMTQEVDEEDLVGLEADEDLLMV
jgi:hypothetical protein